MAGAIQAKDFAEVQGLSLTLKAQVFFNTPEIRYVPEPTPLASSLAALGTLALVARRRATRSAGALR
jgi:hypothetical protein